MAEVIPDMPVGTLGFRVSGHLTRDDYVEVLVPPLRQAVEAGMFSWMVPGEMRMFHESELEEAKRWLTE
jgi:hypothetical protein